MSGQSIATVKFFDNDRGAGILTNNSGLDVFVHYRDIQSSGFRTLLPKQRVIYTEVQDENGLRAIDVCPDTSGRISVGAFKSPVLVIAVRLLALLILIAIVWYALSF